MIKHTIKVETKFNEGDMVFFLYKKKAYKWIILSIYFDVIYDWAEYYTEDVYYVILSTELKWTYKIEEDYVASTEQALFEEAGEY
jgi:hypothetical protein